VGEEEDGHTTHGVTPCQLLSNPYEDPGCQETHYPQERTFYFFSAFQGLGSRQSVACPDLISAYWRGQSVAAPNTY